MPRSTAVIARVPCSINREAVMRFTIYYRLDDVEGHNSAKTKEAAIDEGCKLIDLGAEVTGVEVESETLQTMLTTAEIRYESERRHGLR
jgi:hypothetical protein